jgi:hypothetical protein
MQLEARDVTRVRLTCAVTPVTFAATKGRLCIARRLYFFPRAMRALGVNLATCRARHLRGASRWRVDGSRKPLLTAGIVRTRGKAQTNARQVTDDGEIDA